jgi:hypothetical protein
MPPVRHRSPRRAATPTNRHVQIPVMANGPPPPRHRDGAAIDLEHAGDPAIWDRGLELGTRQRRTVQHRWTQGTQRRLPAGDCQIPAHPMAAHRGLSLELLRPCRSTLREGSEDLLDHGRRLIQVTIDDGTPQGNRLPVLPRAMTGMADPQRPGGDRISSADEPRLIPADAHMPIIPSRSNRASYRRPCPRQSLNMATPKATRLDQAIRGAPRVRQTRLRLVLSGQSGRLQVARGCPLMHDERVVLHIVMRWPGMAKAWRKICRALHSVQYVKQPALVSARTQEGVPDPTDRICERTGTVPMFLTAVGAVDHYAWILRRPPAGAPQG